MDFTSKGLKKPTDAEFQDVADINYNSDRINAYGMGAYVCTSTTHPSGADRWEGQIIYETDTEFTRMLIGGNWIFLSGRAIIRVENTTAVSAPNGSVIGWGSAAGGTSVQAGNSYNPDSVGSWDTSSTASLTIAEAGIYSMHAIIQWNAAIGSAFRAYVGIEINGTTMARTSFGPNEDYQSTNIASIRVAQGAVIRPVCFQGTGATLTRNIARLNVARVG